MFELPLLYVNVADRERHVAADLRGRQILKVAAATDSARAADAAIDRGREPSRTGHRLAPDRARPAGR